MSKKEIKGTGSRRTATKNIVQDDIIFNPEFPDVITVRQVQVLTGYRVQMRFSNGDTRELDLKPYLRGRVFDPIRRDAALFMQVYVDPETETLTWPTGVDMDPETLYLESSKVKVIRRGKTAVASPRAKSLRPRALKKKSKSAKSQTRPPVRLQAKNK